MPNRDLNPNEPLSLTKDQRSHVVWLVAALLCLLLLPILYVLSVGPYNMIYGGGEPPSWAYTFYFPLIWLEQHSESVRRFLVWYASFWLPKDQ